MEWIIQLPILIFSVVVHEFSHGLAAYRCGDTTAERMGRLTLNPVPHLDAFGSVFLPLLCLFSGAPAFGWARPVPVNPRRFGNPRKDMVRVALMGPLSNIVLALAAAVLLKIALAAKMFSPAFQETFHAAMLFAVTLNLFLAFFNLIPVFPLEGFQILSGLLRGRTQILYNKHMPYGVFIILALLFTRGLTAFVAWPMQAVLSFWTRIGIL